MSTRPSLNGMQGVMVAIGQSLRSITIQGLDVLIKIRLILIGLLAIGLGILFGYLIDSPETGELIVSIVLVTIVMMVTINNPLNGMLIWLFLISFIDTWIEIPMGSGIPDLSFSRFTIAFLAIFMLASAAIGKLRFKRISLADICVILVPIGITIAAPLSKNPVGVLQQIALDTQFAVLIAYFFAKNLVQDRADLHKLFMTMVLFGFVAALYAIYEQSTGHILFVGKGVVVKELWTDYSENLRLIRGLLERAGNFGRVFTATIPLSFYLFFESKTIPRKILLVGIMLVQAYGLFLTYNRTSWYGLLISLTIIQLFYSQFRKAFFVIVFVAVVALWATWDQVNDSDVVNERVNSKVSTLEGREALWQAGYAMWQARPIRGWGFGRYEEVSGRFRTDGRRTNFTAIENDYLYIMVGSGLIGFLPYLLFLLMPLINSVLLFFKARAPDWSGFVKPELIAIYWGIIISFAIGSYTQIQNIPIVKIIPFAVVGAIVGTHEHLLRAPKTKHIE